MAYNLALPGISYNPSGPPPTGPETGLTLTRTLAINSTHPGADFGKDDTSVVHAMDFTGLDGSSGGMIYELGGSAKGGYVGFRANGDFIARAGTGADPVNANTGYVLVSGGSSTITGTGTLVVEIDETTALGVRVWWNGTLQGTPVDASGLYDMSGGNDGGIFVTGGGDVVAGEVTTAVTYTTASALRVYAGQTVS